MHDGPAALTGLGSPDDKQQSEDAGLDSRLTKPVDASELERVLNPVREPR